MICDDEKQKCLILKSVTVTFIGETLNEIKCDLKNEV